MLTLTVEKIRDLAEFAGLVVMPIEDNDALDDEYVIDDAHVHSVHNYRYLVWSADYPDEGSIGLGKEIINQ